MLQVNHITTWCLEATGCYLAHCLLALWEPRMLHDWQPYLNPAAYSWLGQFNYFTCFPWKGIDPCGGRRGWKHARGGDGRRRRKTCGGRYFLRKQNAYNIWLRQMKSSMSDGMLTPTVRFGLCSVTVSLWTSLAFDLNQPLNHPALLLCIRHKLGISQQVWCG